MNIEEITQWAKEFTMQDGGHAPTLFLETDKPEMLIAHLAGMPATPEERLSAFINAGRDLGMAHRGEKLVELAFISMNWATMTPVGQPLKTLPSKAPNRKELLTIRHIKLADSGMEYNNYIYEVLRTKKSKKVDLVAFPAEIVQAKDYLLFGLITAYQNPLLTNAQIMQIIHDEQGPQ